MLHTAPGGRGRRLLGVLAAAVLPLTLLISPSSSGADSANPITLVAPSNLPGVAPLPGPLSPTFSVASSLSVLNVVPAEGVQGTPVTISGTGLAANTAVALEWSTSNVTWVADVEPGTVNYLGRSASNFNVTLTTVTTDAHGAFSFSTTAPSDFGGIHTIYAVINNVEVAQGGFTLLRIIKVTPSSGPIAGPSIAPMPKIAIAPPRSFGGNVSKSSACAVGCSAPPPMP